MLEVPPKNIQHCSIHLNRKVGNRSLFSVNAHYLEQKTLNLNHDCVFKALIENQEAGVQRYSVKKVFLEISQNSQENTCAKVSFLIKLQA